MKSKKAQEELVGFAVIIVIVAVLILIFISFSLNNNSKNSVESFEVESYLQAMIQYTSKCKENMNYLTIRELISACEEGIVCENQEDSCDILKKELEEMCDEAWKYGKNRPVKGYALNVSVNGEDLIALNKGNFTGNSRSSKQDFINSGNDIEILFEAYY